MPVFVKASRRARAYTRKSVVKTYLGQRVSIFAKGQMQANLIAVKKKFDVGKRKSRRSNFESFYNRLVRKAHRLRNS